MIGYRISETALRALIEEEKPGWLDRAADRMERFRELGRYEESSSIWSEVKVVYMRLQGGSKCVYCERKGESPEFGRVEQDLEHFRPKGRVRPWPLPESLRLLDVIVQDVPDEDRGYYLLSYHPFNYAASCKPCNSVLKSDYFPVAAAYNLAGDDPVALLDEKPYLIYPIGDFDEDPEDLIRFHGVSPQAVVEDGHRRSRALLTIEFFKLDDIRRKNLIHDRARVILALYLFLRDVEANDDAAARAIIDSYTSDSAAYTNCARSYLRLFEDHRDEAENIYRATLELLSSSS